MYTKNILAVSGALLSAVAAVPLNKRDIVWVTHTDVVMETVEATQTVWVQPGETVAAAGAPSHYGHSHGHYSKPATTTTTELTTSEAQPTTSSTPVAETSAAETTSTTTSSPAYVAPTTTSSPTTSSTPVYVAPTTSSTTSSVYVAPTTPTTSSVYVAPTTYAAPTTSTVSSAAPASTSSSSGSGSSGGDYTGEATFYQPGLGSCGTDATASDEIVALSHVNMLANYSGANSNDNPLCNKWININYNGKTAKAKVVDTCPGCAENGIDLSPTVFEKLASLDEGRLFNVEWSFA